MFLLYGGFLPPLLSTYVTAHASNSFDKDHLRGRSLAISDSKITKEREVTFRCSDRFLPILKHLNASLLISTYQAGKVVSVSSVDDGLTVSFTNFQQAMGIATSPQKIAVGSHREIWTLEAAHPLAGRLHQDDRSSTCYLTRSAHVSGNIQVHEMSFAGEELWAVNTLFSCLCNFDGRHSFVPKWKPRFISELAAQDRCHLNGLAISDGQPKFVSALSQTNDAAGWRETKSSSGCLIDVESNEIVLEGLCMPHSPRLHQNKLWFLNSGRGEISLADMQSGKATPVDKIPAYARGLCFGGQFAFIGMSKVRESSVFGGLPISDSKDPLRCGVCVLDSATGRSVAWFEFVTGVDEIFEVEITSGVVALRGPHLLEDQKNEVWYVPPLLNES